MIGDRHYFSGNQSAQKKCLSPNIRNHRILYTQTNMKRRSTQISPLEAIATSLARLAAKLQGKRYFRTGSCTRCGECCRNMKLLYNGKIVETLEEFEELVKSDSSFAIFTPSEGDGPLTFTCSHILNKGTCGIYGTRPESCRRYPDPVQMENHGGDMIEGCGFELHRVESFERIFSREVEADR